MGFEQQKKTLNKEASALTDESKKQLITNMAENLQMLRVRLGLTQSEIAGKLGISRHTIMNIESKKREMTWNNFLALLLLFTKNEETNKLLNILEIYTDELNDFIKNGDAREKPQQSEQ